MKILPNLILPYQNLKMFISRCPVVNEEKKKNWPEYFPAFYTCLESLLHN